MSSPLPCAAARSSAFRAHSSRACESLSSSTGSDTGGAEVIALAVVAPREQRSRVHSPPRALAGGGEGSMQSRVGTGAIVRV